MRQNPIFTNKFPYGGFEVGEDKMEESLYYIVKGCKQNRAECFEEIYKRFLPLLKKYSCSFYDKDDAFDALFHSFILCLYQMPIEQERFKQEGIIVSYISTTIRNQYYALCREEAKRVNTTCNYDELQLKSEDLSEDEKILLFSLKNYFKDSEIELIKQKIFWGYTDVEIAKLQGVSRQAVNKKVHRVINKLKELYKKGLIL